MVAIRPIYQFEPNNLILSLPFAPDRNRMMAVRVIPNRNISTKFPSTIYNTHSPIIEGFRVRVKSIKLNKVKTATEILPAKERKLLFFKILSI